MLDERGKIYNRDRSKQTYDFSGLRFGTITPTDADCSIEYHNRGYIFAELKLGDKEVPFGQRLFLERLTDDLERSGKPTLTLIASHNVANVDDDIDVANTIVKLIRYRGEWHTPINEKTTFSWINAFIKSLDINITFNVKQEYTIPKLNAKTSIKLESFLP